MDIYSDERMELADVKIMKIIFSGITFIKLDLNTDCSHQKLLYEKLH